jgi:hypothetical protein
MKIFRDNINSQFEIENGLVVLLLPQTKKLVFTDANQNKKSIAVNLFTWEELNLQAELKKILG